jgi:predicted ArsR family transcriptional regulator
MAYRPTKSHDRHRQTRRIRLIPLLRGKERTVNELSIDLGITDNAVRAHLDELIQEGLVVATGKRTGVRKPHTTYTLTVQGELSFPKRYDDILRALLTVLAEKLSPVAVAEIIDALADQLAAAGNSYQSTDDLKLRMERAVALIEGLGGCCELEGTEGAFFLQGYGCPVGALVPAFPGACALAVQLLGKTAGLTVKECCQKGPTPRCRFEIVGLS